MAAFALVFPGQGSQYVGMSDELLANYAESRRVFDEADSVLGYSLSEVVRNGPSELLRATRYAQPALFASGLAALAALNVETGGARPLAVAGHSLGEFTALAAAGAIGFADGLRLVSERGKLMQSAGDDVMGSMIAVLGLDLDAVSAIRDEAATHGTVVIANYNSPGQVVLSGETSAVAFAGRLARDAGARRVLPLAVGAAFHSPLMRAAAEQFAELVARLDLQDPAFPVVANTTAALLQSVDGIRRELTDQMTSPVRWTDSVRALETLRVDTYVELGPGSVLSGLIRRIIDGCTAIPAGDAAGVRSAASRIAERPGH